jgi:multidrug efflux pump subunit AcrB
MEFTVPFDTAPFVKLSIMKVLETFVEAMVLVFFVMLLFLHKIRCTLIPAIVAPVALLHLYGDVVKRFFHQHFDHVWHGAGNRHYR